MVKSSGLGYIGETAGPGSKLTCNPAEWLRINDHRYCDVPIRDLCQTSEIVVRCFDALKNSQPEVRRHLPISHSLTLKLHLLRIQHITCQSCVAGSLVIACGRWKTASDRRTVGNYTGMMNNCWYRVRLHTDINKTTGQPALLARHPVAPGGAEGGWMKPSPAEQAKQEAADAASNSGKEFTLEEVEKHNNEVSLVPTHKYFH